MVSAMKNQLLVGRICGCFFERAGEDYLRKSTKSPENVWTPSLNSRAGNTGCHLRRDLSSWRDVSMPQFCWDTQPHLWTKVHPLVGPDETETCGSACQRVVGELGSVEHEECADVTVARVALSAASNSFLRQHLGYPLFLPHKFLSRPPVDGQVYGQKTCFFNETGD